MPVALPSLASIAVGLLAASSALAGPPTSRPIENRLLCVPAPACSIAGDAQLDPSLAVDPGNGDRRVVAFTDWSTGTPRTAYVRTTDGATYGAATTVPLAGGVSPVGLASAAWGNGNRVYVAHLGRDAGGPCDPQATVYLSQSDDGGAGFGAGSAFGLPGAATRAIGWPSLAVQRGTSADGQPVVAYQLSEATGGCGSGGTTKVALVWRNADGGPLGTYTVAGSEGGTEPAIASIAGSRRALVVFVVDGATNAQAKVADCTQNVGDPNWDCSDVRAVGPAFAKPGTIAAPGGGSAAIPIAPRIAVDACGIAHVVYTTRVGSRLEAVYTHATTGSADTWSAPVPVGDPTGPAADRFLPAVATPPAPTCRADIVYLDRRADGASYDAYATSFRNDRRGQDIRLSTLASGFARPGGGAPSVGSRLASVTATNGLTDPRTGHHLALWPEAAGGHAGGDVVEAEVWHGWSSPAATPSLAATKNMPTPLPALARPADPDGDPVDVSLQSCPGHGGLVSAAGATVPCPGPIPQDAAFLGDQDFAGDDSFTARLDDGHNAFNVGTTVAVVNTPPVFSPPSLAVRLPLGAQKTYTIAVSDPNPGDQPVLELQSVPTGFTGSVSLAGQNLTISVPDLWTARTIVPWRILLRARDTSIDASGKHVTSTSIGEVLLAIDPAYAEPDLTVDRTAVRGMAVHFATHLTWKDDPNDLARSRSYSWSFGDKTRSTAERPTHVFRTPGPFAGFVTVTETHTYGTVTATRDFQVEIPPEGSQLLWATQVRVGSSRVFRLRTRWTTNVVAELRYADGPRRGKLIAPASPRLRLVAGKSRRFGPAKVWTVSRLPAGLRVADLVVRFVSASAQGPKQRSVPLRRRVYLR